MRKTLFCILVLLSAFIISYSDAQTTQPKPARPDPTLKIAIAKPVIKNATVGDQGTALFWIVTVENTGNVPTSAEVSLNFSRNTGSKNDPPLPAGGVALPVIAPGQTREVTATLNPDPQIVGYTIELVLNGKVLQSRPYGLGKPTMEVAEVKAGGLAKSTWEAVIKNTWLYTLGDIKVQAFKKGPAKKDWESVGERNIQFLRGNSSSTVKGAGDTAGADQFKVAVFLRRIAAEPYVEVASKTVTLTLQR